MNWIKAEFEIVKLNFKNCDFKRCERGQKIHKIIRIGAIREPIKSMILLLGVMSYTDKPAYKALKAYSVSRI